MVTKLILYQCTEWGTCSSIGIKFPFHVFKPRHLLNSSFSGSSGRVEFLSGWLAHKSEMSCKERGSGQSPLWDTPAGIHGSFIHQSKYPVQDHEYTTMIPCTCISLYKTHLQGIMVVVFIKTNIQSKLMKTTTMIDSLQVYLIEEIGH